MLYLFNRLSGKPLFGNTPQCGHTAAGDPSLLIYIFHSFFFFLMYSFYLKEVEREIFYGLAQPPSALRTRLGQAEASPALAKWSGHLAVLPSPSTRARSCSGWNWRSMGYQRCTWQHLPNHK